MATFTDKQRQEMAKTGVAMPDGSYPIRNKADLANAISSYGRATNKAAVKAHILKRAKALGATDTLPKTWSEADPDSLDEQSNEVRSAWRASTMPSPSEDSYVREVFDDHVVVCVAGKDYSIPYSEDASGNFVFDTASATEVEQTWIPVTESFDGQLLEAADTTDAASGSRWKVRIIAAGRSKNGRVYPEAVLRKAVPLFEGARVLARSDQAHISGQDKSVANIVGWLDGITYERSGIFGYLNISEAAAWLRTMLTDAWSRGKKDLVGLSIVAEGTGKETLSGRERLFEVEEISKVSSVDVVFDPAAGGGLVKLVAAEGTPVKEDTHMDELKELTLDKLKADRPDLVAEVEAALKAAADAAAEEAKTTEPVTTPAPDPALVSAGAVTEAVDAVPVYLAETVISTELAKTQLPEAVQSRISKRYQAGGFKVTDLREAIKEEIETFAAMEKEGLVRSIGATRSTSVGLEEADKAKAALDGFFLGEDAELEGTKIRRFRSFREAYAKLTGDVDVTGFLPREPHGAFGLSESNGGRIKMRLGEVTDGQWTLSEAIASTTFDQALGDSITRAMVREYTRSNLMTWGPLVDIVPVKDFRTQRRVRVAGYGNLPAVNQAAAYAALTSPTDEESTYAPSKRGGTETISLEAIANDDIGSITRIPQRLARAAAQTLHEFVFEFLNANPTLYDTVAFFHATHANLGSVALSVSSLSAALQRMRKQAEAGSSKRLGLIGRHLWVPIDLEQTAFELTASDRKPTTSDNDANFIRQKNIDYTVVDYWTDVNNWYLSADKSDVPIAEVGFYGSEEPELFTQDMPNVGSMFTNDQLTYKIRHIYGGAVIEYRGVDGSVV